MSDLEKFVFNENDWVCNYSCENTLNDYDFSYHFQELEKIYREICENVLSLKKQNKKSEYEKCIKQFEESVNIDKIYERLGVDIVTIIISRSFLSIIEPQKYSKLLLAITILRQKLADCMGYIIPKIRVLDSTILKDGEYEVLIRGKSVFKSIIDENISDEEKFKTIISNVESLCFKYVHQIVSKKDILKLIELVSSQEETLVSDILPEFLSVIDLKYIFAELIKNKISIKDILFVFEILNYYARYTQNNKELVTILKKELMFDKS